MFNVNAPFGLRIRTLGIFPLDLPGGQRKDRLTSKLVLPLDQLLPGIGNVAFLLNSLTTSK